MGTEIDFVGYAADCRVEGRLELEGERLSDMLNTRESLRLRTVVLTAHADGRAEMLDELELDRAELIAVVAVGPRGNPSRQIGTRSREVEVRAGPYVIRGFIHGPPAGNAFRGIEHRPPLIALTEARLEYQLCGEPVEERVEALLVNRQLAASVREVGIAVSSPAAIL